MQDLDLIEASKVCCSVGLMSLQVRKTSWNSYDDVGDCLIVALRLSELFHILQEHRCQVNWAV